MYISYANGQEIVVEHPRILAFPALSKVLMFSFSRTIKLTIADSVSDRSIPGAIKYKRMENTYLQIEGGWLAATLHSAQIYWTLAVFQ